MRAYHAQLQLTKDVNKKKALHTVPCIGCEQKNVMHAPCIIGCARENAMHRKDPKCGAHALAITKNAGHML